MIRDYPQYGHDWEISNGTSIGGQNGIPIQSGIAKRQLGSGIGHHAYTGSRCLIYKV